jgi:membrane associated rhomboid family serine protease
LAFGLSFGISLLVLLVISLFMGVASGIGMVPTVNAVAKGWSYRAAGNLGADLGLVIGLGMAVSVPAACAGLLYARKVGSKIWVEPKTEITYEEYLRKFGKLPSAGWTFASILWP